MDRARRRDGLLALGVLAGLLRLLGPEWKRALRDSGAALAGIGTALAVEWAFLRYPERLLALWERPAVNRGSALALLAGGLLARGRPRVLAAACWGLVTYLGLFGRLLVGEEVTRKLASFLS